MKLWKNLSKRVRSAIVCGLICFSLMPLAIFVIWTIHVTSGYAFPVLLGIGGVIIGYFNYD